MDQGKSVFADVTRNEGLESSPKTRSPLLFPLFVMLIVLNVAMPKGGIAVGEMPLTFGYIALLGLAPLGLLFVLRGGRVSIAPTTNFLFGYVPIAALTLLKLAYFGSSLALLLYTAILVVFPAIMLLIYAPILESLTERQIGVPLVWCIRFAVVWGIANFLIFAFTKGLIEIPYVTVNPLDIGQIYDKNNRRGVLMKLVSTYNNGNLFGVCMVMLFPVYVYYEKSRAFIVAFCLALVLTLSRTVWFGLAGTVMMMAAAKLIRIGRPSVWLVGGVLSLVVLAVMPFMGWTMDRVVEARMGGRMVYWDDLVLTMFGGSDIKIREVLYASLLQSFGIIGTLSALAAFCFPLVYGLARLDTLNALRRSALVGVAAYLFMAFSDAAFIYPPTIVIFLFVTILLYRHGDFVSATGPAAPPEAIRLPTGPMSLSQAARRVR